MTFDHYLALVLGAGVLIGCLDLARAIRTGELRRQGAPVLRSQAPADFKFEVAMILVMLVGFSIAAILSPAAGRHFAPPFVFGALILTMILRALRYGRIHSLAGPCTRIDRPFGYWATIALLVASLAAIAMVGFV
jgi:hypothetical protein